jgi:hypothetical protein
MEIWVVGRARVSNRSTHTHLFHPAFVSPRLFLEHRMRMYSQHWFLILDWWLNDGVWGMKGYTLYFRIGDWAGT